MVPVLYVIAAGLALWGVVVILSGDLVAMLDIATGLFGSAALVAGLATVASALNRIARTINRITVEATETQEMSAATGSVPIVANPHDHLAAPYVEQEVADTIAARDRRREARARRKGRAAADPDLGDPDLADEAPIESPPANVTEQRLNSGARAWVERRDTPEAYAPRRRLPEAAPFMPPAPPPEPEEEEELPPSAQLVRSGTLNGVLYRFYADGSVEAVTPTGLRRFRNMEELRETIIASRVQAGPVEPPAPREPEPPPPPRSEPPPAPPRPSPPPAAAAPAPAPVALPPAPPPAPARPSASPEPRPQAPEPKAQRAPDLPPAAAVAPAPVVPPAKPAPEPEPEPEEETPSADTSTAAAPEEEQLTPEKRLALFQQNIWATTLAELRRPLAGRNTPRSEDDEPPPDERRS